jgi:HlyD family secretion protein
VSKKPRIFIVLTVLAIIAGVSAYWYVSQQDAKQNGDLVLYGNVDIREVRLAFNGSEHVAEILVKEGDHVKAGQLVARLHTERLQAVQDRARAQLAAAKAQAHAAQLTYKRIKSLASSKLASQEQADVTQAQALSADAAVDAARAELEVATQALNDANLYAPESGIVRERIVEPGDFVTPQTPVITIALADPVWVRSYLPESYLGQVHLGDHAAITTDSFPGKVYQGWVGFISPTAEFTPKNVETPELRTRLVYQVRIFACNPQFELRLGMPATVSITPGQTTTDVAPAEERCTQKTPEH